MTVRRMLPVAIGAFALGCSYIGEHTAPKKEPATERSPASLSADQTFWNTLHGGDYAHISAALEAETAAYLANPNDDVTAAHVGWLHIWRISERSRLESVPAAITDDATLARQYFEQAVALHPGEARYLGFLASATLAEGNIHQDQREIRHGYFMLLDSVKAWPEFNLFTAGYVMSSLPAQSDQFKEALAWEWKNLDVCVGEKVDRKTGEYSSYMKLRTDKGVKRVCWNSWIAPHNFEGFFLNLGDMQVKAGDWQLGQKLYANAKLESSYSNWQFRDVLEKRIQNAQENVAAFNSPPTAGDDKRIMGASTFACVACHQQ